MRANVIQVYPFNIDKVKLITIKGPKGDPGEVTDAELQAEITARQAADLELSSEITNLRAAVGSPLVANTVAAMTDTEKVYVYTGSETGYTAGNWYYYNGSAWVSGGTYNAVAIGDGDITTAKIANGAVTGEKASGAEYIELSRSLGSNVYDSSTMNVDGKWIGSDGNIKNNAASKYAKIPVEAGSTYLLCYGVTPPTVFGSNQVGCYLIQNASSETIQTISPQDLDDGDAVGGFGSKWVSIPANGAYLLMTVKLSTTWDSTSTLTVQKLNIVNGLHGLFGAKIYDKTVRNDYFHLDYGLNRNPDKDTDGYLTSNGSIKVYQDWKTTDFCYVGDLESIRAYATKLVDNNRSSCFLFFLTYYNANKVVQGQENSSVVWSVPEGIEYVRFCYHSNTYDDVMLTDGLRTSPAFVSYHKPFEKLDHDRYHQGTYWGGKKWAAVGDSLTESNVRATKNYHDYVAEATGITVINMGSSGTGYKRSEDESKAFYQRISSVPLDTDVVTIFGSGNDCALISNLGDADDTGTSTICGCINTTIDNLYTILPTVQLGIVTPCPWGAYPPYVADNNMERYAEKIVEICRLRGIPCLDLYHCSGMRPWDSTFRSLCYTRDEGNSVHPDENGHKILAPHFKAFLETLLL